MGNNISSKKESILQKELNKKEILLAIVVILIAGLYGYMIVYPKYIEYKSIYNELSKVESEIKSHEEEIFLYPHRETKLKRLTSTLDIKTRKLDHNMEDGIFLMGLSDFMDRVSVDLLGYNIGEVINYEKFYAIPTTLTIRGDYEQVREVMNYIETQSNMTQILDYNIESYIETQEEKVVVEKEKVIDDVVYWVNNGESYHEYGCGLFQEAKEEYDNDFNKGSHEKSGINDACEVCKPYTIVETEHVVEQAPPKANGKVTATYEYIMYSSNDPTSELEDINPNTWNSGKDNPFVDTVK